VRVPLSAAALTGVILAITAVGCGSSSSPTTSALSAAEWRGVTNAICDTIAAELDGVQWPLVNEQISPFIAFVAPLWKRELDSTRALGAPDEISTAVTGYVNALDYFNGSLVALHIATARDITQFDSAWSVVQDAARDVKESARALRLPSCANQRIP
jgi:hypothetical protein